MIVKFADGRKDGLTSFYRSADYIEDAEKTGGAVSYENIEFEEYAAAEMTGTAMLNKRVKDPVEHIILSWPEEENPSDEEIMQAGRDMLKGLNLGDHQAILAVHRNTDNVHLHMIVNKVHPLEVKVRDDYGKIKDAHKIAREIEIKNDWHHDNGIFVVREDEYGNKIIIENPDRDTESSINQDAERIEAHQGTQSFDGFMKEDVKDGLFTVLKDKSSTWEDVHAYLGERGVALKLTASGKGLVFQDVDNEKYSAAANKVNRNFSKGKLEKDLGKYEAPQKSYLVNPSLRYDPDRESGRTRGSEDEKIQGDKDQGKPLDPRAVRKAQRKEARDNLYKEFREEKRSYQHNQSRMRKIEMQRFYAERDSELKQFNAERKELLNERLEQYEDKELIKAIHVIETVQMREELKAKYAQQKAEIADSYQRDFPSWKEWTAEKAEQGDKAAQSVQRGMKTREGRKQKDDTLERRKSSLSREEQQYVESLNAQCQVEKRQTEGAANSLKDISVNKVVDQDTKAAEMQYSRKVNGEEKKIFTDNGDRVRFSKGHTYEDVEAAMLLQKEKNPGNYEYRLRGNDEFKENAIKVAAIHGLRINNPELKDDLEMARTVHELGGDASQDFKNKSLEEIRRESGWDGNAQNMRDKIQAERAQKMREFYEAHPDQKPQNYSPEVEQKMMDKLGNDYHPALTYPKGHFKEIERAEREPEKPSQRVEQDMGRDIDQAEKSPERGAQEAQRTATTDQPKDRNVERKIPPNPRRSRNNDRSDDFER